MGNKILHIDGDSFFASCEASLDPRLQGLPIVTGHERGIATSMSKEAKTLGITRGMPVFKIKKDFPQVKILRSSYLNYEIFCQRMYTIVRRFTPYLEEYSVDECFAYFPDGLDEKVAMDIKETLKRELDMTFSLGVAPTKVLAKVASKKNKPDGLTIIESDQIEAFLKDLRIGSVWGIGPQTSFALQKYGVYTALDFIKKPEEWVKENFSISCVELWHELQGNQLYRVNSERDDDQKSIQMTRTFTPPTNDKSFLLSELSKNIEGACAKARLRKLSSRRIYYFLKTQEFRYQRFKIPLISPVSLPNKIMNEVAKSIDSVYQRGVMYRTTGVTLAELIPNNFVQKNLFNFDSTSLLTAKNRGGVDDWNEVFKSVDKIDRRYGSHSVVLGSSLKSFKSRNVHPHRSFKIPYMGEVV